MDIALVIVGPLLRLGLLVALLLSPMAAVKPAHPSPGPLDVRLGPPGDGVGLAAGSRFVLVNGKPFFPIGVSYHFTRHRDSWDEDLRAMRDMGLNTVRIDIGWRDIVPLAPGRYRFSVLDEFLDRAARHGLYVVPVFSHTTQDFNTPLWFWILYRDWRALDQDGEASLLDDLPSFNHPDYRKLLSSYIHATVRHIKDHPAVLAYQLLNEPRYHQTRLYDYNPYSVAAFRQWLKQKYGAVGQLNKAWSTTYISFDEVEPLRGITDGYPRESPLLKQWSDWRQFGYRNLADFMGDLARRVKAADANHPVIVAEMAWWWWGEQPYTGVSPLHIYRDADIVGYDLYPDSAEDANYFLLTSDMLLRHWQKPVWVMEMNSKDGSPTGQEIRRFVSMAIQGGASGVFYFQWQDDWRDGGSYGVLDARGARKPQYGGLAATARWLLGEAEGLVKAPPPKPDLYLMWPSAAVEEASGLDSPAWDLYRTASRIVDGGLKVGLVAEELIHLVEPAKLLKLRDGRLEGGDGAPNPSRIRERGWLIAD